MANALSVHLSVLYASALDDHEAPPPSRQNAVAVSQCGQLWKVEFVGLAAGNVVRLTYRY